MHNIILCLGAASVETMMFGNQNMKTSLQELLMQTLSSLNKIRNTSATFLRTHWVETIVATLWKIIC